MNATVLSGSLAWEGTPKATTAGLGTYLGFIWRRNWGRALTWFLITVGMYGFVAAYYAGLVKTTPGFFDGFAEIVKAPALATMVGVIDNPATLGGAVWCKGWMAFSLMLGIGIMYMMTRNLRGDEEAGRLELMRANPLGIRSPLAASVVFASVASIITGLFTALILLAANGTADPQYVMAPGGAFAFGASVGAMGLLGVGIAALTNQIAPSDGAANGLGIGIFALFYVIRAIGDYMINDNPGLRRGLLWVSPIGWGELVDPWGRNLVLPIVLMVVFAALLVFIGWQISTRRDMSASLVEASSGPAKATKFTQTVAGLAFRTQRVSIIVWLVGIVIFGAILGSVINKMGEIVGGVSALQGQQGDAIAIHIFFMLPLAVAIFGVQSASTLRTDEERGVLESQLAGGVSRVGWACKRLAVTLVAVLIMMLVVAVVVGYMWSQALTPVDPTKTAEAVKAIFAHLPAVILMIGVPVLGLGWWPRQAGLVSWVVVGAMWVLAIVGLTVLPAKLTNVIPFAGGPFYPDISWAKEIIFLVLGIAFIVAGLIGFKRRDVPTL